jgi:hypothetical protein
MKKLFTLSMALIFTLGLAAQNLVPGGVPAKSTVPDPVVLKDFAQKKNATKALESRWYCFAITMDDILQSSAFNFNNLFPDTTILVDYGTSGFSGPWVHSLGNMLDPTSDWFNDPLYYPTGLKVNKNMPYSLDSVGMNFI